jgi:uncharacterized protein (TIGR02145 family)
MKKLTLTLIAIVAMLAALAQTPDAFNYQAAVRNADGEPIAEQEVAFEISILQGSADGTAVYTETHTITTTEQGIVNFAIGNGTTSNDFSAIDWATGPYFVQVAFDAAGGTDYIEMGTTQLLSVPYAKYAENTNFANEANTAVMATSATTADDAAFADESSHAVNADTANYAAYAATAATTADMAALLDRIAALEEMNGIGTITDIDGNEYPITKIGNQVWMAKNLRTTRYADGTPIPKVEGNSNWQALGDNNTEKAYCWYLDDSTTYAESNGAYYTFAAANNGATSAANPSGVQGACPVGWHVPSDAEWQELLDYLAQAGHDGIQALVLKDTTSWNAGGNGTNLYDFSAKGIGYREPNDPVFSSLGLTALFLSSTEVTNSEFDTYYFQKSSDEVTTINSAPKSGGFSIRCIKD